MARNGKDHARARTEEIERYKRAAEETLDQLDWCVNYLYRIRKDRIAQAIQKNRRQIRQRMTHGTT
jgi:hypothetical protein